MYSLEYVSPTGEAFELLARGSGVRIEMDTLDGLVGSFEDSGVESAGEPGQRASFLDRVFKPIEGSFTVVVDDPDAWHGWYSAWSTSREGVLVLRRGGRVFRLPACLAAPLPFPGSRPRRGSRIAVNVIGRGGCWLEEYSGTGSVTVTNYGDVPVWPVIVWDGAGGAVVLPSGAIFTLPAVTGQHVLPLRRSNSGRVWHDGAKTDVRVDAVAESVPPGDSRSFIVPPGTSLTWSVGVLNPWT